MIPKVADSSDKIMRKIKENREHCRFHLIEKRSSEARASDQRSVSAHSSMRWLLDRPVQPGDGSLGGEG
jgi:hypothetical protein